MTAASDGAVDAARPVGDPDAVTAPWWEATRDRRLTVQTCRSCGHAQHYPRALCVSCGATDLAFAPAAGRGTLLSWTEVHRAPHRAFTPPYVVGLVRLAEGPILLTTIVGADPADLACDLPVVVDWEALPDGRHLPTFRPG